MDQQAPQQRQAPAAEAPQQAAHIAGPAHAPLAALSESLNDSAGVKQLAALVRAPARELNRNGLADARSLSVERVTDLATASATIQRMTINSNTVAFPLDEASARKLKEVIAALKDAVALPVNGRLIPGTVTIEIINDADASPATTGHVGKEPAAPDVPWDIKVWLNRWYLEKASVGAVIGMVAHELGVHTLADRRMMRSVQHKVRKPQDEAEKDDQHNVHYLQGHKIRAFQGADEPRRQGDHVNLAKSLAGGDSARSEVYQDVFLRAGNAIFKAGGSPEIVPQSMDVKLRDLTTSYLFDLARIVVTDDGRAPSFWTNSRAIADMMNFFMLRLEKFEPTHRWLTKDFRARAATSGSVKRYLLHKIGQLIVSSHPVARGARRAVVGGLVTGLATGVALGAGLAAGPALAVGATAGLVGLGVQMARGV